MASPASIAKHPIHPILVTIPIGLWIFALVCDLIFVFGGGVPVWKEVAYYAIAGGVVGALLAAVPGLIDLLSLTDPKVKRIAIWHMLINLFLVGLFSYNWFLRRGAALESNPPVALSALGVVLLLVSGWLGGELVFRHGVAVEPRAPARPV